MRWTVLLLAATFALFASGLVPSKAWARGIDLFVEYGFVSSSAEVEDKTTGEVTERDFSSLSQLYNLNISRNIYPNLLFKGGGILELDDFRSTIEGDVTKTDIKTIRPFVDLRLSTPLYVVGVGYNKTVRKRSVSDTPSAKNFLESYNARLVWRPVGLPRLNVTFTRDHVYDDPRTTDVVSNLLTVGSRYAYKTLDLDYAYTRNESDNKITDFERVTQSHNFKVGYSRPFFNKRVSMSTQYRFIYTVSGFSGTGEGELAVSGSGLFALDDSPQDDPLDAEPALTDGILDVPTGIDIGASVSDDRPRNMGLELISLTEVDTIFIYVDQDISAVANSFSWEVYVSDDNDSWTLHATIPSAPFNAIENRFRISFPAVGNRFIKVVTDPLDPTVPNASQFPDIFVTEIEALTTVSGAEEDLTSENHNYNLNLSWRISEKTRAAYNFLYNLNVSRPDTNRRQSFTNSISLSHIFSRIFTGSTSLARTDRKRQDEEVTSYSYGASLRANYLPTFRQTLTYSGSRNEEEEGTSYGNTIFLRNDADLYEGWSASLDLGFSWGESVEGVGSTILFLRTRTEVRPNEKVSVNLAYSATDNRPEDEPSTLRQTGNFRLFVLPFSTVSLFADISVTAEEREETRVRQNYSANWSPFPGGALNLSFFYRETLTTGGAETRSYGPNLRWDITRYAFLSLSYTIVKNESETEITRSKNLFGSLRIRL